MVDDFKEAVSYRHNRSVNHLCSLWLWCIRPVHNSAQRRGNRYKIHSLPKKLHSLDIWWVEENQFSPIQCHWVYQILLQAQKSLASTQWTPWTSWFFFLCVVFIFVFVLVGHILCLIVCCWWWYLFNIFVCCFFAVQWESGREERRALCGIEREVERTGRSWRRGENMIKMYTKYLEI